jgi:hypothetical protein
MISPKIIWFPNEIEKLEGRSFFQCASIAEVHFPPDCKLREIGDEAFCESSLEQISIPRTVTFLGRSCFAHCQALKSVRFDQECDLAKFSEELFVCSTI